MIKLSFKKWKMLIISIELKIVLSNDWTLFKHEFLVASRSYFFLLLLLTLQLHETLLHWRLARAWILRFSGLCTIGRCFDLFFNYCLVIFMNLLLNVFYFFLCVSMSSQNSRDCIFYHQKYKVIWISKIYVCTYLANCVSWFYM